MDIPSRPINDAAFAFFPLAAPASADALLLAMPLSVQSARACTGSVSRPSACWSGPLVGGVRACCARDFGSAVPVLDHGVSWDALAACQP
eukprot:711917-Prymnesium_polylepis.2